MKITQAIITVAIMTVASNTFAATKCKHNLSYQGNALMQNTTAPSSSTAQQVRVSQTGVSTATN